MQKRKQKKTTIALLTSNYYLLITQQNKILKKFKKLFYKNKLHLILNGALLVLDSSFL